MQHIVGTQQIVLNSFPGILHNYINFYYITQLDQPGWSETQTRVSTKKVHNRNSCALLGLLACLLAFLVTLKMFL